MRLIWWQLVALAAHAFAQSSAQQVPPSASEGPISVLDALDIGLEITSQRRTVAAAAPSFVGFGAPAAGFAPGDAPPQPDQAGRLLFAFRRAEPESREEAECTGRILLEASKTLVQRFVQRINDLHDGLNEPSLG